MSRNADVIRGLYESFAAGDVPAVLGAMAPDVEWTEAESYYLSEGNPYRGPGAVAEGVFMRLAGDVDGFGAVPERMTDGGDRVVVEGRYVGTVKATGVTLNAQFVHVWTLADGKVSAFQQYTDTAQWAKALG